MQKVIMVMICAVFCAAASQIVPFTISKSALTVEKACAVKAPCELECEYHGVTYMSPLYDNRNAPWESNVNIADVYDNDDIMCSMAEDATGRVYVCYETINTSGYYAWGLATSTDQGATWDNRAFYANGLDVRYPEIGISEDGHIWIFGALSGSSYHDEVIFLESYPGANNDPDSLDGFYWFGVGVMSYRSYPEVVTYGPGTELVLISWTYDNQAATETVLNWVFTWDGGATSWYIWSLNADGNPDGMTSVGVNVDGPWYVAVHGWEELVGGTDWNVRCICDTLDSVAHTLSGWSTGNTNNDRYPSVFCSDGYGYIAYQADDGTSNNDILFNYSTDCGYTWLGTMLNLTNDAVDETYARLYGNSATIGCAYMYGPANVRFNYSIYYGQDGTWLTTPETVDINSSAYLGYHCVGLLYTASYLYAAYEDDRDIGTAGIEFYAARRTTPIGINEYREDGSLNTNLLAAPNPFRTSVHIDYSIERSADIVITIYDITGAEVRTLVQDQQGSGNHSVTWNGMDARGRIVSAGVYVCTIQVGDQTMSKDIVFMH
ncbi:T9SS type A sorting domain-containing protein [candidate division WOR-3 bacterium]|nr:T9SS type A sorting domain-containing protein [candidate division WOR-3 bacterium]